MQTIAYSIESDDREVLNTIALDTSTGWLTLKADIDREQRPSYEFTVSATDSGVPPLSSEIDVRIEVRRMFASNLFTHLLFQVTDINDNAPQFAAGVCDALVAQVDENSRVGTSVLTLSVSDTDLPPHNVTRIHIVDGDPQGRDSCSVTSYNLRSKITLPFVAPTLHCTSTGHSTTRRRALTN